ncbi:MAG: ATP-binding cassette domain-containing protein [Bacilli bacterium]
MNLIANQSSLDQGSILIDGKEQLDMNAKLELFFVPDKKEAFNNFTGRELFDFIAILYKQTNNDIERYIELLDMQSNIDKLISTYSLGMKQKIWILAMIKSNANNILLDEPYNSLDEQSKEVLTIILKQLAGERKCILTATHDLNVLKDESYNLYNIIDRKIVRK